MSWGMLVKPLMRWKLPCVTLWHLARDTRPVRVRTWEAVEVEHAWHRSSSCLQISGSSSEYVAINDWCDLDVGEGEPGYPEYRARRIPDREFLVLRPELTDPVRREFALSPGT